MTANFDSEVLQGPGGSLIAFFLSLYMTARSFCSVDLGVKAARNAARARPPLASLIRVFHTEPYGSVCPAPFQ